MDSRMVWSRKADLPRSGRVSVYIHSIFLLSDLMKETKNDAVSVSLWRTAKLTTVTALMMSMLMRTKLLTWMDMQVTLKVNRCLTVGARIINFHREIIHAQVWAQKTVRGSAIFPQSLSLSHILKAPKTVWNILRKEGTGISNTMTTIIPETIFK